MIRRDPHPAALIRGPWSSRPWRPTISQRGQHSDRPEADSHEVNREIGQASFRKGNAKALERKPKLRLPRTTATRLCISEQPAPSYRPSKLYVRPTTEAKTIPTKMTSTQIPAPTQLRVSTFCDSDTCRLLQSVLIAPTVDIYSGEQRRSVQSGSPCIPMVIPLEKSFHFRVALTLVS